MLESGYGQKARDFSYLCAGHKVAHDVAKCDFGASAEIRAEARKIPEIAEIPCRG